VPIFCYHHIRKWEKTDSKSDREYIVEPADLEAQLEWLKEEGYHSVSSEQVYEYYANGKPLPDKPIMLSFDDNDDNQYTNALPLLDKYGFKATFFVMTVTIGKENYMTAEQLQELDKGGHDLQPHTWDHHMVSQYETEEDWQQQIVGPKKELEALLGHPTSYFAYPFGIYTAQAAEKLKSYGYKAAFALREVHDSKVDPVFAIKRYITNGYWILDNFKTVTEGGWEQ
jgi:peptidoglycan/xylan/chitin deacetylase (PgdA/CDA1 family)